MSDGVKMIFKSLLGTIAIMVLTSVCIELFNVNITGMQIRHMTKMAARQATELFTQETYKIDNGGGTINAADIKNIDGGTYISGKFYNGLTNMYDIYDLIYGDDSHFSDWCNNASGTTYTVDGAQYEIMQTPKGSLIASYTNLQALKIGVDQSYLSYLVPSNMPSWDDADDSDKVKKWTLYSRGQAFYELCYTPINLGIPYLDAKITNKMFQWNLARLASNCDPDLIQTEGDHTYLDLYADPSLNPTQYFVNYKGFKVYADQAKITKYQYYVFDLANAADAAKYRQLTNNKVNSGANSIHTNSSTSSDFEKEDNYVSVVSITYGVPMEYIGITPLRTIFNYVWRTEVAGLRGHEGAYITDTSGIHQQWSNDTERLKGMDTDDYMAYQSGGSSSDLLNNTLFTTGYLTYTIVN